MPTDTEQLVIDKLWANAQAEARLAAMGAFALKHGTKKKSGVELRLSKADLNRIEGRSVEARELKSGGVVITVLDE